MATVVITFFLFVQICINKMDAVDDDRRERMVFHRPVDPYGMDPLRFEQILAEISAGYNNIRNSFENVNIGDILEEVLTEYANQALRADMPPNFSEVAVLLQHCVTLYSRKVDYLYQHAVAVCEALATSHSEVADTGGGGAATPGGCAARRRRRASGAPAEFSHIEVSECGGARRAGDAVRPPPTLPRMYIELEPRVMTAHDAPLRDYHGEPIGLLADFHVSWRLQDGFLVEELSGTPPGELCALRPLSLVELQAAISAAAPASPPPRARTPPLAASTPLPAPLSPPPSPLPPPPPATELLALRKRKRKNDTRIEDIFTGPIKLFLPDAESAAWSRQRREFSPPAEWVSQVVGARARSLLDVRRALERDEDLQGFEFDPEDIGGFCGWAAGQAGRARDTAAALRHLDLDSEDDGFFERSSFSSFEGSRHDYFPLPELQVSAAAEGAAWSAGVAARAAAAEARGAVDVRALAGSVLRALPPAAPLRFDALLAATAQEPHHVSRILLATLFLANSGNVSIEEAAPLTIGSFSVALRSTDERLYSAAADAEADLLA